MLSKLDFDFKVLQQESLKTSSLHFKVYRDTNDKLDVLSNRLGVSKSKLVSAIIIAGVKELERELDG